MSGQQSFWDRRRAGVAAEADAEQATVEAQEQAEEHAACEDMTEQEVLTLLDLPDPDTLTKGDDFTVFMAKAVPDAIRRRALKVLWRSNPVLANVDMLLDYGEDFTDKAMAVENIQTGYQVGKGMLKHVEEMARQAAERENPSEPEPEHIEEEAEEEVLMAAVEDTVEEPDDFFEVTADDPDEVAPLATPTPRRMKFRVEEAA